MNPFLKMKKLSLALALVVALSSAVNLQPRQAHALIGITSPISVVVAGGVIGAAGLGGLVTSGILGATNYTWPAVFFVLGSLPVLFAGIIILDGGSGAGLQYSDLTASQASQLGLTQAEWTAYSQNLDEVNAVAESVAADLKQAGQIEVDFAKSRWQAYSAELGTDPLQAADTLTAVGKVSAAAIHKIRDIQKQNRS